MIHQRRQALRARRPGAVSTNFIIIVLIWCLFLHISPYPRNDATRLSHLSLLEHAKQERTRAATWKQFMKEAEVLGESGAGAIYDNTLQRLVKIDIAASTQAGSLTLADNTTSFVDEPTYFFNPYPYDTEDWKARHTEHAECLGPRGPVTDTVRVFRGRPRDFPDPVLGSYEVLGIDRNLCFERETRLGPYGLPTSLDGGDDLDWDGVNWGELQSWCQDRNKARFGGKRGGQGIPGRQVLNPETRDQKGAQRNASLVQQDEPSRQKTPKVKESRTAVLLRADTEREFSIDDRQVIRSLITELSLRSGGEYQVFLILHNKEDVSFWNGKESCQAVIERHVPREFWGMSLLWSTSMLQELYPRPNPHFSPVLFFMHSHQEFDYVWNWDLDARVIGHNYDVLNRLDEFAKKQPRKGLWERNQRYYIPSIHGDYDTDFRKTVEKAHTGPSVWGAPPLGPKAPVPTPDEDDYQWGVGEEADLITLSPISKVDDGDRTREYRSWMDLPRRAQHLRASRTLVDAMHAEEVKGNHLAPEKAALVHGLKAVYAPVPVYFDRAWDVVRLERWLNDGPVGEGWDREMGATWDSRAEAPRRLYNRWLGKENDGVGGTEWEAEHGRPCLPGMVLYPVGEQSSK
ncbi:hypothetical protein QBC39DRAFT_154512 [Podospora conica]|nr:hypothetical protein QBC39DRAFT_154512 [Schizothecium conicum]